MAFSLDESLQPRIVYEDENLVAVHKPPRMHSAPGQGEGDLCSWLFERHPEVEKVRGRGEGQSQMGGGLLHRLDFETSGLVLFARDDVSFASLLGQQARGEFYKEYVAISSAPLVEEPQGSRPSRGSPLAISAAEWIEARDEEGYRGQDASAMAGLLSRAIASPVSGGSTLGGRQPNSVSSARSACGVVCAFRPYGPKGVRVACLGSVPAAGSYSALPFYRSDILAASPCSLPEGQSRAGVELRVGLARGFRHQIRAQLAWIGLPIRGDPLYGGGADERLRLYAVALSFVHPATALSLVISEPASEGA